MTLEAFNRDDIRRAAKLAGGVNVTYKTKTENIAFLREQGVVDLDVDSDGGLRLIREGGFETEARDEEALHQAVRDHLDELRDGAEVTFDVAELPPPARAAIGQDGLVHALDVFNDTWCDQDTDPFADGVFEYVREGVVDCPECCAVFNDEEPDSEPLDHPAGFDSPFPDAFPGATVADFPSAEDQALLDEAAERDPATEVPAYSITTDADGRSRVKVVVDEDMVTIDETDPRYARVVTALLQGEDPTPFVRAGDIVEAALGSITYSLSRRTRIVKPIGSTEADGVELYIDDEHVDGKMVDQFVRYWVEGRDMGNLLTFLERVKSNPLPVAETNLYGWGSALTIDADGYFIGFKSVLPDPTEEHLPIEERRFKPSHSGPGAVNGIVPDDGTLWQRVGDVVTIDRELVRPGAECGVGLHVGTWNYASRFNGRRGVVMEVRVDPADIVNVPYNDTGKLRCTRYTVLGFHDTNGALDHHEPEAAWSPASAVATLERTVTETVVEPEQAEAVRGFFSKLADRFRR